MRTRSQRTVFSAIVILVAFCGYRLIAVPFIEPAESRVEVNPTPAPENMALGDPHLDEILERLFPAGSWQRDNPIVMESDRAMLLMHDYKNLPTGEVRLNPCTMIFFPNGDQSVNETLVKRAIIVEAPGGAVLQFDSPVDLRKGKIGKLIGGRLPGDITVRGNPGGYQGQDEIAAKTRDLQLKQDEVWTPHPVDFRIGPNQGHGREMHIKLIAGPAGKGRGLSFSGAQSLELRYDVSMHVLPGATGMLPGDRGRTMGPAPVTPPSALAANSNANLPVDISCRGSFVYQLTDNTATFNEQVNVLRAAPAGTADQMTGDRLSIRFAQRKKPEIAAGPSAPPSDSLAGKPNDAATSTGNDRSGSLEPVMFEASGHPVILRAPSNNGFIQAQRIEYDIQNNRATIEAEERGELTLRQGTNEVRTQRLVYQANEPGRLGRVVCNGPGWLKGASPTNPNQLWEARWKSEFRVNPHEQQQIVTLLGQAQIRMAETGQLDGDELYLWLNETPVTGPPASAGVGTSPPKMQITPDRLMARGNVSFDSAAANGTTDRFEVWFKYAAVTPTTAVVPARGVEVNLNADPPLMAANPFARNGTATNNPSGGASPRGQATLAPVGGVGPGPVANPLTGGARNPAAPPQQHFEVKGKLIRLQLLVSGNRTQLDDVSIEGDALLDETQTENPKDRPLHLEGQQVQVFGAAGPNTTATVSGKPAAVRARGLALSGETIQFDRAANRLWIDAPGRMLLPLDRGLDGRQLPQTRLLEVVWQGKMNFDGLTAHFEKKIDAHTELQSLQTEILDVSLTKKLDFQQPQPREQPQVNTLIAQGGVLLESRLFDGPRQVAWERLQTKDLAINQTTGEVNSQGPGWMTSYRVRGAENESLLGPNVPAARPAAATRSAPEDSLQYVNVQFARDITGNIQQRELTFRDQVRVVYGPVKDWNEQINADRTENLPPRAVSLTANSMKMAEMAARPPARGSLEIEARENVVIEAQAFLARAARASYAQAKELFVLEGDGRDDAQLFRQQTVGGPTAKAVARKILYWRSTNRVELDDARFFDFGQINGNPVPRGLQGLPANTPKK